MWSYFGSIYYSDSNLNRYEVHPTRTVSEGTGPEFFTHFTVGEIKPDRLIGLCLKSNKKAHDYLYIFLYQVQNLGCYAVRNLELSVNLPSVASGDRVFAIVVDAFSHNVSITLLVFL